MAIAVTGPAPAFLASLPSSPDAVLKVLTQEHPDYAAHLESWHVLLAAFEGSGGFLDGSYLWPYPREDSEDFAKRQRMARYHNYLESLVDIYVRFLFTQGVKRSSTSDEYNVWTENVDGANTPLTELLKRLASVGLVHGHTGVLVDKTPEAPVDQTKAGERARVIANVFTALGIPDWRFDRQTLTGIKLVECAPTAGLTTEAPTGDDDRQYLLWATDGWARFDARGELVSADAPGLDLVPFVLFRPKPSYTSPMLGRPLVSNANVIRALFNRASEEDQVIRDQAFSLLTVSVPPDGDVKKAKEDLGHSVGTTKAIVVRGEIKYQTPDQNVPGTIRENIAYLVRELYRAAHVRFDRDSLQAEAADAIRLQHSELNELLQGIAKALAQAEREIARAYFAWQSATPEIAQAAFEAARVEATYPTEFFLDDLVSDLEAWGEAVRLNMGATMERRIKKRAARRVDPNMPQDVQAIVDREIDALPTADSFDGLSPFPKDTGQHPPTPVGGPANA